MANRCLSLTSFPLGVPSVQRRRTPPVWHYSTPIPLLSHPIATCCTRTRQRQETRQASSATGRSRRRGPDVEGERSAMDSRRLVPLPPPKQRVRRRRAGPSAVRHITL